MTEIPTTDEPHDSLQRAAGGVSTEESPDVAAKPALMKDLPPVEPPSAGFIVQLFVIPAVIVMAVLGVWLLFGQLATGEYDWRKAVANIKSENPHIRWRAAMTLSEMLNADQARGEQGQHLAENEEIASALCDIYAQMLTQSQFTEEQRNQLEYLSIAIGRLHVPAIVNPVLVSALQHEDEEIQAQGLVAASMIAGADSDHGRTFDDEQVIEAALDLSHAETSLVRHPAVYLLGLVTSDAATSRLESLLNHGDSITRINAAIGLARRGSTAGLPMFKQAIDDAISEPPTAPGRDATAEEQNPYVLQLRILKNSIEALDQLKESLTEEERAEWANRLERFAAVCDNDVVRLQALEVREGL